jgi:hypothetical protein
MIMNKILSIFLALLISNSLFAQENGKVYFIRSEGFQAPAAAFTIFIDHKNVGRLGNKKYSMHTVKPGEHTFTTQFGGTKSNENAEKIEKQIEAGKTYYIKVTFKHGILKNKLHFKEVNEEDAKKMMASSREIKG